MVAITYYVHYSVRSILIRLLDRTYGYEWVTTGIQILTSWISTSKKAKKRSSGKKQKDTLERRFNEYLYNQVLGITDDILQPCQSYSNLHVKISI